MENVNAEAIFDFNPTDSIELTFKVCELAREAGVPLDAKTVLCEFYCGLD